VCGTMRLFTSSSHGYATLLQSTVSSMQQVVTSASAKGNCSAACLQRYVNCIVGSCQYSKYTPMQCSDPACIAAASALQH
jgi:hypothetical protein